jgi:phosphatidylinositol dimannoside acyltransferase
MNVRATSGRLLLRMAARLPNRKFTTTRAVYAHAHPDADAVSLARLAEANVDFVHRYYFRLAALRSRTYRRRLYRGVRCEGTDALHDAARDRRGVVLVSVHLGDFDVAGAWLAEVAGLTPVVTTAEVPSRVRQLFFDGTRRACGVVVRREGDTRATDLLDDLWRGRLVLVMLDRRSPSPTVPVRFLGQPLDAPTAGWELARLSGALLLPGATWRDRADRLVLWCGQPVSITSKTASSERDAQLQALADELEIAVRQAPHQLHVPADPAQLSWRLPVSYPLGALDATAKRTITGAQAEASC